MENRHIPALCRVNYKDEWLVRCMSKLRKKGTANQCAGWNASYESEAVDGFAGSNRYLFCVFSKYSQSGSKSGTGSVVFCSHACAASFYDFINLHDPAEYNRLCQHSRLSAVSTNIRT